MSARWAATAFLTGLLLVLATPGAAAQDAVDVRAPLDLFGDLAVESKGLTVYHHAFDDGTMAGTIYRGTLTETVHEQGRQPQSRTLADIDPDAPLEFSLHKGGLVTIAYDGPFRFYVGPSGIPDDETPAEPPVAAAGPNPARTTPSDPDAGDDPFRFVLAMPTQSFLVVPQGGVNTTSPFDLQLNHGNLTLTDVDGGQRVYRAGVQTVEFGGGILPTDPDPYETQVLTTYRLNATRAVYALRQEAPQTPADYWQGDEALAASNVDRPPGAWPRDDLDRFGRVLREHGLAATVLASDAPVLNLEGVARLTPLKEQSAALPAAFRDARSVELGGTLAFGLADASDDHRTMTVHMGGDVGWTSAADASGDVQIVQTAALVGGLGLVAVAGTVWAWPLLKFASVRFLVTPLYARIHRDEVLEHPVRDDILSTVAREPGISASELGRRAQCGWGTLVYHLSVLERERMVWSAREGRHRRYFAQGRVNYSDRDALGLLRNVASRRLADAILQQPGVIQKDLSRSLKLAPSTVAWHVDRLVRTGLLRKVSEGRQVRYYPSQRLETLVSQVPVT